MDEIHFVDTTIRDGHQSLWAERMATGMMLPIARNLDDAGFLAIEILSGSHIKKAVRELREDPWERISRVAKLAPHTPLRLIAGRVNTFGFDPPCMYELFIERMAANGIRQARISEPWNDLPGWKYRVEVARRFGLDPIINLIYSVSPVHTDDYYAERCRQAVTLQPFRLCLKDPGGLLTPERVRTLVPVVLRNSGGIPVELHSHCTTGLGPLVALEAVRLGIRIVNTGVPPLSQFVGSQAAINVIVGERYKEVTDQVIRYALGHFGEEAVTAMDQEVRSKILDRPRAKEIIAQTRSHPTIADMRRDLDAANVS